MRSADGDPDRSQGERGLDQILETLLRAFAERNAGRPPRLAEWVDSAERWYIRATLREHRDNRVSAARALGIGRRTLYAKLQRLGIGTRFSHFRRSR